MTMPFKTLAAILRAPADAGRILDFAIPLASTSGSHVVGIHAEAIPLPYPSPTGVGSDLVFLEATAEANRKRSAEIEKLFRSRTDAEGISAEWLSVQTFMGESAQPALANARASDLVIVQQVDPGAAGDTEGIETLLFESGRPVLLIPYAGTVPTRIGRALVAWNGSRESARATFDALPFLHRADKVELLLIDKDAESEEGWAGGAEIAETLARHGVKVNVRDETAAGTPIGAIIGNRVAETGADLLVMGAYSRSRLSEWLFGGATRTVLESMPALTLMSR
jgi:nucleotide-binding universal stress UspA family protein